MLEYERLISRLAHQLYSVNQHYSVEDLIQVGWLTAIRIDGIYDTSKAKKTTFLTICVKRDMVHFMKKFRKVSLKRPIIYDEPKPVGEITDGFDETEKVVAELLMDGFKKTEIAKKLSISFRKLQSIIEKIGEKINA